MIFGALVVLLIGFALAVLIISVVKKPSAVDAVNREQQNIAIAREKKALLNEQLAQEQMTAEEYQSALVDLETSLAIDLERQQALASNQEAGKWVIWLFIAFVPVLSIFMYWELGEYQVIENPALAQARTQTQTGHGTGETPSIDDMINKVKNHLRDNPEDVRGWFMLGRTYMTLDQYDEAVTALQRAHDLSKNEPNIMLALADALAMVKAGDMTGDPEKLVKQALERVPNDPTALWLAGLAAEQGGRYREAYDYWMKLIPLLKDDPQSASEVKGLLVALREKQPDLPELDFKEAVMAAELQVDVSLDQRYMDQVKDDDTVFIYAKAASGPPMPLAAERIKVSDLPILVTLSDEDAMMPQMKLSEYEQVIVGARVSKSGDPIAKPGDLFNESEVISRRGFEGVVEIYIDQIKQ